MIADSSYPLLDDASGATRPNEAPFRALMEAICAVVWRTNPTGQITHPCPQWEQFTGENWDRYRDLAWMDAIHPEDRERARTALESAFKKGNAYAVECRLRHREGAWRRVALHSQPELDSRGEVSHWLHAGIDVTDRALATEELRKAQRYVARQLEITNGIADSLADSELRLRLAMDAGQMGTWEWPMEAETFDWSPALEELHGHRPASCDSSFEAFLADIHPEDRPAVEAAILQTRREWMDHHVEYRITLADGTIRWIEARGKLFTDGSGTPQRMVGVCTDVTPRKWAEQTLRQSKQELERIVDERTKELQSLNEQLRITNRELEDFASVASHDLQEPLRKIQAFGGRLEQRAANGLDPESRDYLGRMMRAAGRMQRLITDLLQFSRVTTRAQPFAAVDLNLIVTDVLSDLEARIEQSSGNVETSPLPTLDADPVQMQQLFQNLIGNGLKFHRPGVPPVVRVFTDSSAPEGYCTICVEDNGIGFDEKYLDRIFNVFQRLHPRTEYEGTGIGLAVCRKIAERHGGSITARSAQGQGSVFVVMLPLRHDPVESANVQ